MGDWPSPIDGALYDYYFQSTVTANAIANTKGAWAEVTSGLPRTAVGGLVSLQSNSPTHDFLIDLGIGAGGSEVVLVANLLFGNNSNRDPNHYRLPIILPAGQRLAGRCQSTSGGAVMQIHLAPYGQGFVAGAALAMVETLGATVADSAGTSVDPGAAVGVKGNWVQFAAATTYPYRALLMAVGEQRNANRLTATWNIDIGLGGAGVEQVLIPNLVTGINQNYSIYQVAPHTHGPFPVTIPAGTRLAIRASCTINDATDRLLDFTLYGFG